ncbi:hypothetical protein TH66_21190 [Carbonactinospora thermoautotrophica]|uniref:Transcription factor zinc-finger domain-containing protein n=1 Tax=Carbonactinospora thermoautotrophica TaxID=1469144 RepID=A0A132NKX8_9ACTN|nr:zf-TFIIB domain-containing protein [Carbonactinospora thermoautotrophica]KWW97905.1 hypothetical protein TH66_21190 [Carbonactinospora thermoautotrophica]KWX10372.1 hypothetical protein TR74_03990 [Carbonactinospora thermoautotrophica]
MDVLVCPKCQGQMRSYERNRVTVDQCTVCHGIFLDRGELERLIEAETAWYEERGYRPQPMPPSAPTPPPAPQPQYYQQPQPAPPAVPQPQYYQQPQHYPSHGHPHHKKHKKESFFEELFDF